MSDQPPTTIIQPTQQAKKRGTSCFNCKKAHSKCDGQFPCSQCTKKGKICIPQATTTTSSNNKNDGDGGGSDDNEVITPKQTKKNTIVMASKTKSSAAKKSKSTASSATASRSIISYFSKNGNNNTNNDGSDDNENNEDNDNDDNKKKKKNIVVVKNEQVEAEDEEGESTPTRSSKRRAAKRKLVYSDLVSSSEEEAEDDENDDDDEGGKKKKKKKVIKTPTKKTSSSAAKKRRKKSDDDDGDEDFVISVRDDDEDDDEYMDDDRNQLVKEEEESEEADDDENDDDDDEEFATPSKRASSSKKRGEATPRSLSSSNISATPTRATPKTVTKVVKSAQKKTPARAMKLVKAPIPKRPGKELANSDGVVTQGLRTFFVNKSRVVKGKKQLIHYETTDISMLCPVPNLLPIITHNEQVNLLDESHPQHCTTLYVDKNPASVDFLSKKPSNTGSLNRDAVMHNIKIGQSASIKNDSCLLLNVGGGSSVWCMDWCRRDTNSEQYAVFACHPLHKPYVRIDEFYSGPENESEAFPLDNMIQIWSFGGCVGSSQSATDHPEPARCVTCIKHNHGFAWDCKWLPITVMNLTDNEVLGVLAVAFSDGALVIYTVPKLNHPPLGKVNCVTLDESQLYTCSHGKDEKKLFTALGWSLDGRFLASGCSDGNLIIWKVDLLAARDGSTLKKMAHVRGHFHRKHGGRVRSISWSSVDINVFATCGDDGNTRYWDIRDIFEPHCSNLVSRQWATDVCYPANTTGCISVSSDGQVKQFDARENNFTCVRAHAHPLWSVSVMSTRAAFAYSSADGSVMLSSLEEDSIAKKPKGAVKERFDSVIFSSCLVQEKSARDSVQEENNSSGKHICVSLPMNNKADKKKVSDESARQVTDLLQQKQEDLVSDGIELTPSSSKKKGKKKATPKEGSVRIIPDHSLSIFSVRFHHSRHKSLRNWCILGGQAGYVCAVRVPDELEV